MNAHSHDPTPDHVPAGGSWPRPNRDEGVVAVMVGLLIVTLLIFAAFAVELGEARAKKRELRTGADAAVLAIAENCGWDPATCTTANATSTAASYATANDEDGTAGVANLQLDTAAQTVSLETYAIDPDSGQNGVETHLAKLIGIDYIEVGADAAALWGWAGSLTTLPLIIDMCTFENLVYEEPALLVFFDGTGQGQDLPEEGDCTQDPAGQDAPGAFGWLDTDGTCHSFAEYLNWVNANPGGGAGAPPKDCDADWMRDNLLDQDVALPVYSTIQNQGNNTDYLVAGFATFHITAYQFGNATGYTQPPTFSCPQGAGQMCMTGHFTTDTIFDGEPGGANFGLLVVKLTE